MTSGICPVCNRLIDVHSKNEALECASLFCKEVKT